MIRSRRAPPHIFPALWVVGALVLVASAPSVYAWRHWSGAAPTYAGSEGWEGLELPLSGHVIRQEWNLRALFGMEPAWDQPGRR